MFIQSHSCELEQIEALELRLTGRDVLMILPTGYRKDPKELNLSRSFFLLHTRMQACLSDFAAYKH